MLAIACIKFRCDPVLHTPGHLDLAISVCHSGELSSVDAIPPTEISSLCNETVHAANLLLTNRFCLL